jgi:uncharacterized membrane protein
VSVSIPVSTAYGEETLHRPSIHPLHAFLLGGALCFFASGLLSDWAYFSIHEIQWKNFASWLIIGGLLLGGFALLWAFIDLVRAHPRRSQRVLYFVLLLAVWILGFVNELVHAKDAFASMPEGLIISAITTVLMTVATWIGFSTMRTGLR